MAQCCLLGCLGLQDHRCGGQGGVTLSPTLLSRLELDSSEPFERPQLECFLLTL